MSTFQTSSPRAGSRGRFAATAGPATPAGRGGPPYRIPVAPLTDFYAAGNPDGPFAAGPGDPDGPDGSGSGGSGGGGEECDLRIRDLFSGEIVSEEGVTTEKCVGQHIRLAVEGTIPAGAEIEWKVPWNSLGAWPGAVRDYDLKSPTGWQAAADVKFLDEDARKGKILEFYWTNAVRGAVTVSVKPPEGGAGRSCGASAEFRVVRPTCGGFRLEPAGVGAVRFYRDADGDNFLRYGYARGGPGPRGMLFGATPSAPADFGGHFGLIETIDSTRGYGVKSIPDAPPRCRERNASAWGGGFVLDRKTRTVPFFNDDVKFVAGGAATDLVGTDSPFFFRPGKPEERRMYVRDRFEGYLMFRPRQQYDGEDNIFVTVREFDWSWEADVERASGTAAWPATPRRAVPVPGERDSIRLPLWSGRVQDFAAAGSYQVVPCPGRLGR